MFYQPEWDAGHLSSSSVKFMYAWDFTSVPHARLHGMAFRHTFALVTRWRLGSLLEVSLKWQWRVFSAQSPEVYRILYPMETWSYFPREQSSCRYSHLTPCNAKIWEYGNIIEGVSLISPVISMSYSMLPPVVLYYDKP
jgi:hypothetical protein